MTIELDRRSFLIGLFGTAAIAAAGPMPTILEPIDLEAWARAVSRVYGSYIQDCLIYGCAGIRYTDKFPYIENVPPSALTIEQITITAEEVLPITSELSEARRAISDTIGRRTLERLAAEEMARKHTMGELD